MDFERTQQEGHTVYSRPLWGKEKFFWALAEHHNDLTHGVVQLTVKSPCEDFEFEERLETAFSLICSLHPILLAIAKPLGDGSGQMVCTLPASWDEARNVSCTKIRRLADSNSGNSEEFLENLLSKDIAGIRTAHLWWARVGLEGSNSIYSVALGNAHCLVDARGAMVLLMKIMQTVCGNFQESIYSQWSLISQKSADTLPPPLNSINANKDINFESCGRCLGKWRNDNSKMNYIIPPKTRIPSAKGTTRSVVYNFSPEDSKRLFYKHKSLGVTMTTALQASLWLATVIIAPPSVEDYKNYHCTSLFAVDSRNMLRPEWKHYIGCGITDASLSCPLEIATGPDRKAAMTRMMRKITEDMIFWRANIQSLIHVVPTTAGGAAAGAVEAGQKGIGLCNAFTSNIGIMDGVMPRLFGTKGSPHSFEVTDFAGCSRITEPQYFTRAWTFDGKCTVLINYNDHYYDKERMEELVKTTAEVLLSTLDLAEPIVAQAQL